MACSVHNGTPTVPCGSGLPRVGGDAFLTRRHGGAEKHAENMFGLASVLGTQPRKVKTRERAESAEILRLRSEAHAGGGRLTTGARGGYCEAASFTGIRRPYGTGHPGRRNDDGTGVYQDRSGSGMKSPGLPRGRGRSSTPAVGGGDRLAGELPASAPDL